MKILVFGAGVLGCNLARNLFRAGKDVTLLARGNRANEIKSVGLKIKDKFSPRVSVSRIPVATELKPEDSYDVIFVVVRYTQIESVLDALRSNRTKISYSSATIFGQKRLPNYCPKKRDVCLCAFGRSSRERPCSVN